MRRILALAAVLALAGCASELKPTADGVPRLAIQQPALNPTNGGRLVAAEALRPGDIVLSSADGLTSAGIRLLTLAPVSHAALYVGDGNVAEAVGHGIQLRKVDQLVREESMVVAFRDPRVLPPHADRMNGFVDAHVGRKYDFVGVMLQAPFSVERRLCEVPMVPGVLRDFCIQGVGAVQLGLGRNDRFFCSQFVLEAYRHAGLPLTDADPRLLSPADLLHMREGDLPSVQAHQALQYVGHLKFTAGGAVAAR